jgi:hypothetical protein
VKFRFCVCEALGVIAAHLDALNDFRQLVGITSVADLAEAFDEIERWQADMRQRYGHKMDADDLPDA